MAMRRRRIHAEYAVITALISTASSVVGAAQLPVTTWPRSEWAHAAANEPMHQVTTGMQKGAYCANDLWKLPPTFNAKQKSAVDEAYAAEHYGQGRSESGAHGAALTALIRPAPVGEITPEPQIPTPTVNAGRAAYRGTTTSSRTAAVPPTTAGGTRTTTRGARTATRGTRTTTRGASSPASAAGPCPARTVRQEVLAAPHPIPNSAERVLPGPLRHLGLAAEYAGFVEDVQADQDEHGRNDPVPPHLDDVGDSPVRDQPCADQAPRRDPHREHDHGQGDVPRA